MVLDVEVARDLKAAVKRFARELGQGPSADNIAAVQQLLLSLGARTSL